MQNNESPDSLLIQYLHALVLKSNNIGEEDIDVYCSYYEEIKRILQNYASENGHHFINEKLEELPLINPVKYRKPVRNSCNSHTYVIRKVIWYYRMDLLRTDTTAIAGISNAIIEVLTRPGLQEMIHSGKK